MPWAPKRACAEPGCGVLVDKGRCSAHVKQQRQREDADRPNAHRRGYDRHWQRLRSAHLAIHPMCACGQAASCVDHVVALNAGGDNTHENLRSMCQPCHSRKTIAEDGGFGHPGVS